MKINEDATIGKLKKKLMILNTKKNKTSAMSVDGRNLNV